MSSTISWNEDYQNRMNPKLLTTLLHEAVPVLGYVNWQVIDVSEGYAKTTLPLNYESTNQHGTHQAALIALAADYTGGIALASLIRGVPITGVHPNSTDNPAALWLVSIDINYKVPSAGDLTVVAQIPASRVDLIRRRYEEGRIVVEKVEIQLEGDDEQVAVGTMTYFFRQSKKLRPQSSESKLNALFSHSVKASARLISALRGMESTRKNPLYYDPYSSVVASAHGKLLAERFTKNLPQLQPMIAARTKDIDDLIEQWETLSQVVFLGIGFDFRPFRLFENRNIRVFEIDLPHMLVEREKIIANFDSLPLVDRVPIELNLELDDLSTQLIESGFKINQETLFILEGTSMYFDEVSNCNILRSVQNLMGHLNSKLWIDIVDNIIVERRTTQGDIIKFLEGMDKLGEPFIFGLDNPHDFFQSLGYRVIKATPSNTYLSDLSDQTYRFYNFFQLQKQA